MVPEFYFTVVSTELATHRFSIRNTGLATEKLA
jgi:hypothetical protein